MLIVTSAKTITRVLILTVLALTLAGLGARFIRYVWGDEGLLLHLLRLFDVGAEASIATWYSSFALLLSSALLAVIAALNRRRGDRYTAHWIVLSVIFLLLSMDEVVHMHEVAGGEEVRSFVHDLTGLTPGGFTYFFWVVPGAAFALVVLITYLRFLIDLPGATRRLFLVAGALFVLGALGMEMLSARVVSVYGTENWDSVGGIPKIIVGVQTSIEELFEMMGIVIFIHALVAHVGSCVREATVQVRIDDGGESAARDAGARERRARPKPGRPPKSTITDVGMAGGAPDA